MIAHEQYTPGPAGGARLAGQPIGRVAGAAALTFDGWRRLHAEYAKQFGVERP